jgi:3-methyladenine DNA glycosylase AlkD
MLSSYKKEASSTYDVLYRKRIYVLAKKRAVLKLIRSISNWQKIDTLAKKQQKFLKANNYYAIKNILQNSIEK